MDERPEWLDEYNAIKTLPDGRICAIHRMIFTYALLIDCHPYGYEDRYCYKNYNEAVIAMAGWDGTGEPQGWHRHPDSGRRRDPATGREWVNP